MSHTRERCWRQSAVLALGLAALAAGCAPKPRAPALMQGEPVYQNKQEGFRFQPPPNWNMHARAEVPPGKLTAERLLVGYKRVTGPGKVASLDLTMADVPTSTSLETCLEERASAREGWQPTSKVELLEIGGQPAARGTYRARLSGADVVKEIVAVRKGERVYFFTAVFPAGDARSREQVRKAVESLRW